MIRALNQKRGELDGSWLRTKKTKNETAGDLTGPRQWYPNPSDNPSQRPRSTSGFGAKASSDVLQWIVGSPPDTAGFRGRWQGLLREHNRPNCQCVRNCAG